MGYVPGLTDDEAKHARYCDLIANGPRLIALEEESVVWSKANDRILLVTDGSPEGQRKLAHEASICANQEMHYDFRIYRYYDPPDERQVQIFLYVRTSNVVGLFVMEKRTRVWCCTWNVDEVPACFEQPARTSMWSVGFVWLHKQFRGSGVAYTLFGEAKRVLNLGNDDVGWHTPFSEDGEAFVRRLYPTYFFVAK